MCWRACVAKHRGCVRRLPRQSAVSRHRNSRSYQPCEWETAMSEPTLAALYTWLVEPLQTEVQDAITRLRCASDVHHVAVMPDVHLAADVCVGVAIGTDRLIYPQAVGGDIGCGILAVPFDIGAG